MVSDGYRELWKGKVLWTAAAIEADQSDSVRLIVTRAIRLLTEPQFLKSDAPACVEFILFHDRERQAFLLYAVNVQEILPALPVGACEIRLKPGQMINAVKHIPDETDVPFEKEGEEVILRLENLGLFDSWMLLYDRV